MVPGLTGVVENSSNGAFVQEKIQHLKKTLQEGDVKQASQDFEAYFISYMLKAMRETVPKGILTQNRMGETFQSFYDEAIGKQAAKVGGIGLAQFIEARLRQDQEGLIPARELPKSHPSKVITGNNR